MRSRSRRFGSAGVAAILMIIAALAAARGLRIPLGCCILQLSWRPAKPPASGATETAHAVLREGLATNRWVFEALHRDDPEEVAEVRTVAESLTEGAATDRLG